MKTYYYSGPSIDHTLLSPSGKCSKRTRAAMLKREAARLFPPGFWEKLQPTDQEKREQQIASLRHRAKELRVLASRGMCTRKYRREADKLELEADALEN